MTDIDCKTLLSEDDLLKLPYYALGRKPGKTAAKTTIFRNRKYGLETPGGGRAFLRGVRCAGGYFYRREDVDAFFRAINGECEDGDAPTHALKPATKPSPNSAHANPVDAAEAELAAAGIA